MAGGKSPLLLLPLQCTTIANCQTYSIDCSCDACATGYEECSADVCVDLNTDANNW